MPPKGYVMAAGKLYYRRVEFFHFKAFKEYRIDLKDFNILVGPNNAGKSTIITAFRILAAALRKAASRRAEIVVGRFGQARGYKVDLRPISVAEENIFYNYDDSEPAYIVFTLSNGHTLTLFFPESGSCTLIADASGRVLETPSAFNANFDCQIGFVPILGPVDHNEQLYEKEAARLALFNYRAARNFRNIWYHYPDRFDEFQEILRQTWPGMDVDRPVVERIDSKVYLYMYCPEKRVPREIFWSGFGFQVWCQMLTHLVQSRDNSLFLIDEPDIYLHSELQRQLLDLLRNLGPDILIATHSTEIVTEANADEIVVVDKDRPRSRRIRNPSAVEGVFELLGSNLNPILTQLAKTRRALFVEGKDFQILGRFARRLGKHRVSNRSDFAVVPMEGFNPEKMKNLKTGMEATLGTRVVASVVLDRDYRSLPECAKITGECRRSADYVTILSCKEIENFLLVPAAIDRAAARRIAARPDRSSAKEVKVPWAESVLAAYADSQRSYISAQFIEQARKFERVNSPSRHETEVSKDVLDWLEGQWSDTKSRLALLPGKEALSVVNAALQREYGVSITPASIIEAMQLSEIDDTVVQLVSSLEDFSRKGRSEDADEEEGSA